MAKVDAAFSSEKDLDLHQFSENMMLDCERKGSPEMVDLDDDAIIDLWKRHTHQQMPPSVQGWQTSMTTHVVSLPSFSGRLPDSLQQVSSMQNASLVCQGPTFQAQQGLGPAGLRMAILNQQVAINPDCSNDYHRGEADY
jgi:hypothetical protein